MTQPLLFTPLRLRELTLKKPRGAQGSGAQGSCPYS